MVNDGFLLQKGSNEERVSILWMTSPDSYDFLWGVLQWQRHGCFMRAIPFASFTRGRWVPSALLWICFGRPLRPEILPNTHTPDNTCIWCDLMKIKQEQK